jgi:hypothetical protein
MSDFIYNFVVFKMNAGPAGQYFPYRFFTSYTVKSATEYDEKSMSFVASRLVLAERVMLFGETRITHVVVYEHRDGKIYDSETETHTLLSPEAIFDGQFFNIGGARQVPSVDIFHGLQWKRNKRKGKCFEGYFGGCVGHDDAYNPSRTEKDTGGIKLRLDGPLGRRCWPFYAGQLAYLPQVQESISIDRFGEVKEFGEFTSGRLIGHVINNSRLRSRRQSVGPKTQWMETILRRGQTEMFTSLSEYHESMNRFDHRWGDHHYPENLAAAAAFHRLASIWYPLMRAFGYEIDEVKHSYLQMYWGMPSGIEEVEANTLRWRSHSKEIDSCLAMLFNCHQWIRYYWGAGSVSGVFGPNYYRWRGLTWNDGEARSNAIYEDWDNLTAVYFKAVDAFNVLQMILLLKEPNINRGVFGPISHDKLGIVAGSPITFPSSVPFTPMLEVYPFQREPFIKTEASNVASVAIPEARPDEELPFDSGPSDEEEDEDWQTRFDNATKTVLQKFEFIRRWIGKIRKTMPWYRAMPIEKLSPKLSEDPENPLP